MQFYQQLSKYYDLIFPLNEQSIIFIKDQTAKGPLLDVAAGTGNHAVALAKLGYRVTATDLDEHMVTKIHEKAVHNDVSITAFPLAMQQLDQLNAQNFITIICIGNSLVHLESIQKVKKAITDMFYLLQINGKLIIQVVNYDRILQEETTELPLIKHETEQISFRRLYKHEANKIIFRGELFIQNEMLENEVTLLPLTSQQIVTLLTEIGFSNITLYGSFKGEPFDELSLALIIVAAKEK